MPRGAGVCPACRWSAELSSKVDIAPPRAPRWRRVTGVSWWKSRKLRRTEHTSVVIPGIGTVDDPRRNLAVVAMICSIVPGLGQLILKQHALGIGFFVIVCAISTTAWFGLRGSELAPLLLGVAVALHALAIFLASPFAVRYERDADRHDSAPRKRTAGLPTRIVFMAVSLWFLWTYIYGTMGTQLGADSGASELRVPRGNVVYVEGAFIGRVFILAIGALLLSMILGLTLSQFRLWRANRVSRKTPKP